MEPSLPSTRRYRIVAPIWHEPILHYLCKFGHDWRLIDMRGWLGVSTPGGPSGWDLSKRPLPPNAVLVPSFETFQETLRARGYDLAVCFTMADLRFFQEVPLPKIFFPVSSIRNELGKNRRDAARVEEIRGMVSSLARNCTVLYISEGMKDPESGGYGIPGEVLTTSLVDPSDYTAPFEGDLESFLRVGNLLTEREFLNGDLQEEVFRDLPLRVIGHNPGLPGSKPARDWDELRRAYIHHRAFFSSLTPDLTEARGTMSQIEAMASGMPVLTTPHPLSLIRDGVNGLVGSTAEELRAKARLLLEDRELARALGKKARETILSEYPLDLFRRQWEQALERCAADEEQAIAAIYREVSHAFEGEEPVLRERRRRWVNVFKGCRQVLDVGCGDGLFLDLLKEAGISGTGLDWDPAQVEKARKKGHRVEQAHLEEFFKGSREKFDGIFLSHIIEHLHGEEALRLLYRCTRLLEPGGVLAILTPNIHHPVVVSNFWMDITHKRPYPINLLQQLLVSLGYRLLEAGFLESDCECYVVGRKGAVEREGNDVAPGGARSIAPEGSSKPAIFWKGAFFDPSGYGDEARNFVQALTDLGATVKIAGITKPSPTFLDSLSEENLDRIEGLTKTLLPARFLHLTHFPAYVFTRDPKGSLNVGRVMFESDGLPPDWVARCNAMDEVWVPSQFNRETFTRAGVDPGKLVVIPGGVDADFFTPDGPAFPLPGEGCYRFLSIFEWLFRKGWDLLLAAYVTEFRPDEPVALFIRTYPYGKADGRDAETLERQAYELIERTLGKSRDAIPPIHFLKEHVPHDRMPSLYRACDAYVMPSRGEGWGKPYIEAMACGLPVIATAWSGQMEYLHDGNAYLLPSDGLEVIDKRCELALYHGQRWARPSVPELRRLMRHLFTHREEARAKGKAAREDVAAHWSWKEAGRTIMTHLVRREGASPGSARPGVIWEGSFLVNHSLANANREIALALAETGEVDLGLLPYEPDQISEDEEPRFRTITRLTNHRPSLVDVHVRHRWPPNWTSPPEGAHVLMQPWEFGSLPVEWKDNLPKVREVWAYSNHVRDVYLRAGCPESMVHVIPLGIRPEEFSPVGERLVLATRKKFRFLFVGGLIDRKGIDLLLNAYLAEFRPEEDVALVIKDFYYQSPYIAEVEKLAKRRDIPEILYLHGSTSPGNLPKLFRSCQCYVHPYRGEGFGLPILEAMACALPVITTDYGPALDFCPPDYTYLLPAELRSTGEARVDTMATVDQVFFAEPDFTLLRRLMRHVFTRYREAKERALLAAQVVHQRFTWAHTARKITERVKLLRNSPPHPRGLRPLIPVDRLLAAHNASIDLVRARTLLDLGSPAEAAALLEKSLATGPTLALTAARARLAAGDPHGAREALGKVRRELEGCEEEELLELALRLGETKLAEELRQRLSRRAGGSWEKLRLGLLFERAGRRDEARRIYEEALGANGSSAAVAYRLGLLARERGEIRQAVTLLEQVTELFPGHALAWASLGECASLDDDPISSKAALLQAALLDPILIPTRDSRQESPRTVAPADETDK